MMEVWSCMQQSRLTDLCTLGYNIIRSWKLIYWGKNQTKIFLLFTKTWYAHANTLQNNLPLPPPPSLLPSPLLPNSRLVMTLETTALVWRSVPLLGSTTPTCSELCPIQSFVWLLETSVCWSAQVSNVIGQFSPWILIGQVFFFYWVNLIGQFVVVTVWSVCTLGWWLCCLVLSVNTLSNTTPCWCLTVQCQFNTLH